MEISGTYIQNGKGGEETGTQKCISVIYTGRYLSIITSALIIRSFCNLLLCIPEDRCIYNVSEKIMQGNRSTWTSLSLGSSLQSCYFIQSRFWWRNGEVVNPKVLRYPCPLPKAQLR